MKIEQLSQAAQDGLRYWAQTVHGDELLFDAIGSIPEQWAWICYQLQATADTPRFFPRGKSATIQVIQGILEGEAEALIRSVDARYAGEI